MHRRVRIGIGVGGEYPAEFAVAGVKLSERGRRTEEGLQLVRRILAGEMPLEPEPPNLNECIAPLPHGHVPFLFAGRKDVALERAARLGDGWIGYLLSPDSFARRRARVLEYRAAVSDQPFVTGMLLPVHPDDRREGSQARAAAAWAAITKNNASFPERLFIAGPPSQLVEQLRAYWELGCTEMVLSLVDQGDGCVGQLELLAAEVLPRIREFS